MNSSIWFAPAPARHLAYLRIGTGLFSVCYLVIRAPHLNSFGSYDEQRFEPVGIVGFLRDAPLSQTALTVAIMFAIASGLLFLLGVRYKVSGPAFALALLWVTSYRNSFGAVLHTENLMVLHVMLLSLTRASDAISFDAKHKQFPTSPHYRWPVPSLVLVSTLTYVLAGVAKFQSSGLTWLDGNLLRNQLAYDNLRKHLLGDYSSPFIGYVISWSWVWIPIAIVTLLLELGAPIALLGRNSARLMALSLWGFHVGVMVLMVIAFPYQLSGVAFLAFLLLGADLDTKSETSSQSDHSRQPRDAARS